jgi:hypothetical protein
MNGNIIKELRGSGWTPGSFSRRDFDLEGPNVTGQDSVVADLQADRPVALRDDKDADLEITIPAYEEFQTDGSGGQQTFVLSNDIIDSPATEAFLLYADGQLADEDSVDFDNDEFQYTDDGTVQDLDVFYVARNPSEVKIKKVVSDGQVSIGERVYGENTAILHSRDQSEQPTDLNVSGSEMERYLPRKSNLQIVVNAPYTVRYEGPERDNGTARAANALLSIPKFQTESNPSGLLQAVKADAAGLSQGQGR